MRSISNDDKKDHQKLCPLVKRGTLTMKLAEHSTLRKDGCDSLAHAILARASPKKYSNVNLDFPRAASVLRSVLDGVVSMTSAEEFQDVGSCFSQIYLFWWWLSGETLLLQLIWTQVQSL